MRERVGEYLATVFAGRVSAYYPAFPDGTLARVHYIIGRSEGETPDPEQSELEATVASIARTWHDSLIDALAQTHEPLEALALSERYAHAFSVAYQEAFEARQAISDIAIIDRLTPGHPLAIRFAPREDGDASSIHLKVFNLKKEIPLSRRVPVLENMGFQVISERSFRIERASDDSTETVHLHEMVLVRADGNAVDLDTHAGLLSDAFMATIQGQAENDGYNGLVIRAGLAWRDVAMLRAVSRYLRQIRVPYSQDYMWDALLRNSEIAADLVNLFKARFARHDKLGMDTGKERAAAEDKVMARIEAALEAVPEPSTMTASCAVSPTSSARCCAPTSTRQTCMATRPTRSPSRYRAATSRTCRSRARCARSSSTVRASRAFTCASARSPAAGCAGPTARRTSVPRCSAW